jgi:hypothetical protein
MPTSRIGATVLGLTILAAACGRLNGPGSTGPNAIPHPTGAGELVLRVEYRGGFVPFEYSLRRPPFWSLMGDGTLVIEGPQIEIYPAPALPPLVATPISEEGVQAILRAAREAGLMEGDAAYGFPCIADAPDTVFTLDADGRTTSVSAYALDITSGPNEPVDCPGVDIEARAALSAFQRKLGDLDAWLPEGSVGGAEPYEPTEMRVYVTPYEGEPDLPQPVVDWPLADPLATFGEPVLEASPGTELRCGVVGGGDLGPLLQAAGQANELTPWSSQGGRFRLVFRPLLPDEHAC